MLFPNEKKYALRDFTLVFLRQGFIYLRLAYKKTAGYRKP